MFSFSLYADFFSRSQIAKSICVVHAGGWCPTWRPVLPSTTSGRPFCDIIGYLRPLGRPFSDIIGFQKLLAVASLTITSSDMARCPIAVVVLGYQRMTYSWPFGGTTYFRKPVTLVHASSCHLMAPHAIPWCLRAPYAIQSRVVAPLTVAVKYFIIGKAIQEV